ncbi:MAG: sulfite exporter TauE/SafE family protein [Patescibacteria group bacterium]
MNLWAVFATGLTVGGLTCLAVQGGLLASTIAQREEQKLKEKILRRGLGQGGNALPILSFLGAKLVAYTILGFLLGWFGSFFRLSLSASVILQFAVGIFMIGTALNLLNVHPIFRYFIIQPPRFLTRLVRKQSKSKVMFAPALLGAFTVFIPCGTTQAMMALAIASGNPLLGVSILFAFTLGTSPVFFTLGYLATRLGEALHQKFMKVAAYAIILLAIFNLNNTLALTGSNFTLDKIWKNAYCNLYFCDDSPIFARAEERGAVTVSEATISIEGAGYSPNNLSVKAGSQVTLNLINNGGGGCTQSFTIPRLGIQKVVPLGDSDTITFKAPFEPGQLAFMCGMGMFRGVINVI